MNREFIALPPFDEAWQELGLSDDDLSDLQSTLNRNPEAGDVIPGGGGSRKIRISISGRGKRGGGRVIYFNYVVLDRIYLLDAYDKAQKKNPTQDEIAFYSGLIRKIKAEEGE